MPIRGAGAISDVRSPGCLGVLNPNSASILNPTIWSESASASNINRVVTRTRLWTDCPNRTKTTALPWEDRVLYLWVLRRDRTRPTIRS